MAGEIPERVTCEVCGTSFDPTESRGWCPNEACGKWQHPAFPLSDGAAGREAADGGVNAPTKVCPSCGEDVRADANFCKFCSHEFPDEPAPEPESSDPGLDACPDCGADLSSIPPDRLDDCPICGTDLSAVLADQSEPEVTPADLTNCPACSADLTNIPADMRMVCPSCRTDLAEAIRTHGPDAGTPAEGAAAAVGQAADAGGGGPSEADADVDTLKGIGASYADRLSNAGVDTVGELVLSDPAQLSAATDISEKRISEWIERAPVDAADVGAASGGAAGGASAGEQAGGASAGGQASGGGGGQAGGAGGQAGAGGHGGGQAGGGQSGARGEGGTRTGAGGGGTGGRAGGGQGGRAGGQASGRASSGGRASTGQGAGGAGGQGTRRTGGQGSAGGQGGAGGRGRRAGPRYDTVVFEVMGQEIRAGPGDTVGREIRTAMVEGGAPDDDAVYVHREHLRVEREDGAFYLVRLGQNSLKINGDPVGQGERAQVADGDAVSFSEVVTADVRLE